MKKEFLLIPLLLIIDQIIKLLVSMNLIYNKSYTLISNFLFITPVKNTGGAFSIFSGSSYILALITIIFLIYLFNYIRKRNSKNIELVLYSVLIGGIIGNLVDRIIFGYVIDFIHFKIFSYEFPIFNFADICICISILILAFYMKGSDLNGKNNS